MRRLQIKMMRVFAPLLVALLAFGGFATVQPSAAQTSSANWKGTFYNNQFLVDPPVYEANFGEINFDWGSGSPHPSVNNNGFSARFGADVHFDAGTYRFTISADDAFQLWVDYDLKLSTYHGPKPGETLTIDLPLTAGSHHVQIDYREITDNAFLKVTWVNVASLPNTATGGSWRAEYFSNPNLSGTPFAVRQEGAPNHQWGLGGPLAGMPADNFSVRWTSTQNLPAGNYGIRAFADDGVRVFVNGIAYINEWHIGDGRGHTANFSLPGGLTTIVVEYFEAGYNAFIEFELYTPQPSNPQPSASTATVTTGMLNVRNAPSAVGTTILTKVSQGQSFNVTGRNSTSSWWRIDANGVSGWVSGAFVVVSNAASVPVVDGTPTTTQPTEPTQPTQITVTTVANLHVRTAPNRDAESLLTIPWGGRAVVEGRSADNVWLLVNYNGTVGWVSAAYVRANPPINFNQLPVR